ncbi:MAG: YafY family transcriptional regulator, partial [Proteobacteria bacterium]
ERFYRIDRMLRQRRSTSLEAMMESLGVSRATVKRDLEYLRDRLHAPILWDRSLRGYRYEDKGPGAVRYSLPGLWFNADEARALLTMDYLLASLQPGLLGARVEPLKARIRELLGSKDHSADEVVRRIRVLHMAARPVAPAHFETIASAVLGRRRLRIDHYNRATDRTTCREVSPQRLVHYRDNWYLDAWCHMRDALRSFSVDAIRSAERLERPASEVAEESLDEELGAGYGIFAGKAAQSAVLRFTAERARWVARESWHPRQRGSFEDDGGYVLRIPYADDRELVMDILRYGADVEVLAPDSLRTRVRDILKRARARYVD